MREKLILIGRGLPPLNPNTCRSKADWLEADPAKIAASLDAALKKPSGNWFVLADRKTVASKKKAVFHINGQEILVLKVKSNLIAIANPCPHLGAPLSAGRINDMTITCPWHGMQIDCSQENHKRRYPLADDGHLIWIRMPGQEQETPAPFLPERPQKGIAASIQTTLRCNPEQVIANRLDPWHGAHYHPHTFAGLTVFRESEEGLFLRVAYRLFRSVCMEVDARFHCPDPRTIVMTIIAGPGSGSVVETHATPIAPGYTRLTELTIAHSAARGFAVARWIAPIIRPFIRSAARRLWREDAAYAERRFFLKNGSPYSLYQEAAVKWPIGHPR